jgi:hypothetical protein
VRSPLPGRASVGGNPLRGASPWVCMKEGAGCAGGEAVSTGREPP